MRGCTSGGYDQLETSPETIEQELRPAVCERRQTDRLMENYSIDYLTHRVLQFQRTASGSSGDHGVDVLSRVVAASACALVAVPATYATRAAQWTTMDCHATSTGVIKVCITTQSYSLVNLF